MFVAVWTVTVSDARTVWIAYPPDRVTVPPVIGSPVEASGSTLPGRRWRPYAVTG